MTLRFQYATLPFGGFTQISVTADRIDQIKLKVGDSHPRMLTWRMHGNNYSPPIPALAFVQFWDEGATDANGNAQTENNPAFEGYVETVNPSDDGLHIDYTAYDATRRASNEVTVMSVPWEQGTPVSGAGGTPPTVGTGAVPRLVQNCKTDNDPDYAFSLEQDLTVGQTIQSILEYQYHPLYWLRAAHGDGSAAGNGTAYRLNTGSGTGGNQELHAMDFKPQEKMVFESEPVRSAIARLMQMYAPQYRMIFEPGQRHWRFYNITAGTQLTLTLNDFTGTYKVLSYSLEPSLEECHTAVKIYGPQTTLVAAPGGEGDTDAFTTDGSAPSLVPLGAGINLQNYVTATGTHQAIAYTRYQIVDTTKRRGAKLLSRTVTVPMTDWQFIPVKSPTLQISFDFGETWMTVLGTFFDFQNGIADMVNPLYWWVDPAPIPGSTQKFFPPTTVRLVWAYYSDPITVRKPTTGYEGTAYTVAGLQSELAIYDESLAVGYEYGTPVTTATRVTQMGKLAQAILDERKNVVWTGGCVLEGLKYDFLMLNKRINFTGETTTGSPLTTGWESINAFLTDVEYDYENQVTSLTFSSDQMSLMRVDPERLKEVLKIKALQQVVSYSAFIPLREAGYKPWTLAGEDARTDPRSLGGMEAAGAVSIETISYVDPETGELG